jgi:hypothetical protein
MPRKREIESRQMELIPEAPADSQMPSLKAVGLSQGQAVRLASERGDALSGLFSRVESRVGSRVLGQLAKSKDDWMEYRIVLDAVLLSDSRDCLPETLDTLNELRRRGPLAKERIGDMNLLSLPLTRSTMHMSDSELRHMKVEAGILDKDSVEVVDAGIRESIESMTRENRRFVEGLNPNNLVGGVPYGDKFEQLMESDNDLSRLSVLDALSKTRKSSRRYGALLETLYFANLRGRLPECLSAVSKDIRGESLDTQQMKKILRVGVVYDDKGRNLSDDEIKKEREYISGRTGLSVKVAYRERDEMIGVLRRDYGVGNVRVHRGLTLDVSAVNDEQLRGIYSSRIIEERKREVAALRRSERMLDML